MTIAVGDTIQGSSYFQSNTVANTIKTYSAGQVIGAAIEFASAFRKSGGSGYLASLVVLDNEKQAKGLVFNFYNAQPTAQTDGVALTLTDAEALAKGLGFASIASTDYQTYANQSQASKDVQGKLLKADVSTDSLWVVVTAAESVTFAATNSLTLKLGIAQD